MSGIWDRTLVYLGLREETDDAHDDHGEAAVARFDADADPHAEHAPRRPAQRRQVAAPDEDGGETPSGERARASRPVAGEPRRSRPGEATGGGRTPSGGDRDGGTPAVPGGDDRRSERSRPSPGRSRETATTASTSGGPAAGTGRPPGSSDPAATRDVPRGARRDPAPVPSAGRPLRREPERTGGSNVTRLPSSDVHVLPVPRGATVRVEIVTISAFDEVEQVGRAARAGELVLFDLRDADATTARRVIDFASGIVYALHGKLDRVGPRAFLLRPRGVEVPAEERQRLDERGYQVPAGSEA
jgi:cell division inhibitor SepF